MPESLKILAEGKFVRLVNDKWVGICSTCEFFKRGCRHSIN
jgi:hypothetical protein